MDDPLSNAWRENRRARLTASRIARLMDGTYSSINTLLDVIQREMEEGPGGWLEGFEIEAASLSWGNDNEPKAISLFEMLYDVEVAKPELVLYPHDNFIGATPDGTVVGQNRSVEVKCPFNPDNHELALIYGMPRMYKWQTQTQSLCLENEGVYFMSFDPRREPRRRLKVDFQPADPVAHEQILERTAWFKGLLQSGNRVERVPDKTPTFF